MKTRKKKRSIISSLSPQIIMIHYYGTNLKPLSMTT
jgi:hypothetical protein